MVSLPSNDLRLTVAMFAGDKSLEVDLAALELGRLLKVSGQPRACKHLAAPSD